MEIPETFDWVDARAKCSPGQMFVLLIERIASDVEGMKSRLGQGYQITFNRVADDKVVVAKQYMERGIAFSGQNVIFTRTDSGISVEATPVGSKARSLFTAMVSLGPEGRCRYEIAGHGLELWQVSRKALEELFFA